MFTKRGANRIGKIYKKAVYREFTDGSFVEMKKRSVEDKHLGVLGPIIRAEEGDEVVVVLKNMASRNYSIHPHGLSYEYVFLCVCRLSVKPKERNYYHFKAIMFTVSIEFKLKFDENM